MQYHLNGFVPGDPDVLPRAKGRPRRKREIPEEVDVIVAGCGPAGLCLAAQLALYPEISTIIVEPSLDQWKKGKLME